MTRRSFPLLALIYGSAHLSSLLALAVLGGLLPRWLWVALGAFAELSESGLRLLIDYRGQDAIQWPLLVLNSALYGIVFACLHRIVSSARGWQRR